MCIRHVSRGKAQAVSGGVGGGMEGGGGGAAAVSGHAVSQSVSQSVENCGPGGCGRLRGRGSVGAFRLGCAISFSKAFGGYSATHGGRGARRYRDVMEGQRCQSGRARRARRGGSSGLLARSWPALDPLLLLLARSVDEGAVTSIERAWCWSQRPNCTPQVPTRRRRPVDSQCCVAAGPWDLGPIPRPPHYIAHRAHG